MEGWSSFRCSASQLRKANVTSPGLTNENLYEVISMKSTAPVKVRFPVVPACAPACVRVCVWATLHGQGVRESKHDLNRPNSKANKGRCLVWGDPYNNGRLWFTYWSGRIIEVYRAGACRHGVELGEIVFFFLFRDAGRGWRKNIRNSWRIKRYWWK